MGHRRAGRRPLELLTVPATFPPEPVPNGELLSGLPLPDLRGTNGTYFYFATDLEVDEEGPTPFGGLLARLTLTNGAAVADLVGPPDPTVAEQLASLRAKGNAVTERERLRLEELGVVEYLRVPMTIRWNQGAPDPATVTVELPERSIHLREGEWSPWIDLEFRANAFVTLNGMTQLYLVAATDAVRLYVAPIQWRPDAPPLPVSSPPRFAADLVERLGPFGTMGWAAATAPLLDGRLDERAFLDDLDRAFDERADTILSRLDRRDWNLLVGVVDSTDRVQHMMWRLIDPRHPMFDADLAGQYGQAIERMYQRCDDLLGEVRRRLDHQRRAQRPQERRPRAGRQTQSNHGRTSRHGTTSAGHRTAGHLRPRVSLVASVRQPQYLARGRRLPRPETGPGPRRWSTDRRRRPGRGSHRLVEHPRLRGRTRPDLHQSGRPGSAGHRGVWRGVPDADR